MRKEKLYPEDFSMNTASNSSVESQWQKCYCEASMSIYLCACILYVFNNIFQSPYLGNTSPNLPEEMQNQIPISTGQNPSYIRLEQNTATFSTGSSYTF